jgi:hypothetical protein
LPQAQSLWRFIMDARVKPGHDRREDEHDGKIRIRYAHGTRPHQGVPMKALCYLLGIVFVIIAVMYFVMPADQLPGFMPGHETGVMRVHAKHGSPARSAWCSSSLAG